MARVYYVLLFCLCKYCIMTDIQQRMLIGDGNKDLPSHNVSTHFTVSECKDYLPNCHSYDYSVCQLYQPWALQRCAAYCQFCMTESQVTTPTPPCEDELPNCEQYNTDTCTNSYYRQWALKHCRRFCNMCHVTEHPHFVWTTTTTRATTTSNAMCNDLIPDCASYGRKACTDYPQWAGVRCRATCNFCGTSPPPTTPPVCEDKLANCGQYQRDTCVNPLYKSWAANNCRLYCNLCVGHVGPETSTTAGIAWSLKTSDIYKSTGEKQSIYPSTVESVTSVSATRVEQSTSSRESTINSPATDTYKTTRLEGTRSTVESTRLKETTSTSESTSTMKSTTSTTTSTPRPTHTSYYATGATGPSGNFLCVYKGQTYSQGTIWTDGCQFRCTCKNAEFNNIGCRDRCPTWNMPTSCKYIVYPGECCGIYVCNFHTEHK